jgi:hypothetical protein
MRCLNSHAMKRTLLAIGCAVLASLMLVPHVIVSSYSGNRHVWRPFFMQDWATGRAPYYGDHVMWGQFVLQTVFACVLAAMIVNTLAISKSRKTATRNQLLLTFLPVRHETEQAQRQVGTAPQRY